MPPAIALHQLCAFEGPNIFGPAPGVLVRARCDGDRSARLRAALKDGAQAIGLVIAYLETDVRPLGAELLVSATFTTEAPAVGAALGAYVVEGIAAEISGDEEWDADTPLQALRARRLHETMPVEALRIAAEARRRRLPVLLAPDGTVRIGQGPRAWGFDPQALRAAGAAPDPPWEQLGHIPIIAVTGVSGRAAAVRRLAADLAAIGPRAVALEAAGFAETSAALADPATEALVVGLDTGDLLRRGVAFERCTMAVITDRDGERPSEAADDEEWLRALGVPMLLAEQPARLNLADQRLHPLIAHAPNGVIGL
jgi:hypothetical protein